MPRAVRRPLAGNPELEARWLPTFVVSAWGVYGPAPLSLRADLSQPVDAATLQVSDLIVDGSQPATLVEVVDADTIRFTLPSLAAGSHTLAIGAGTIADMSGTGIDAFSANFVVAAGPQYAIKHNPRLQPGNAPLVGYPGGDTDRVDLLWQTIPAGAGTQDSFTVEYRAAGAPGWQSAGLNAPIVTGVENRVVRSATITGLDWYSPYEYRVRHRQAGVIVGEYARGFTTRRPAGDPTGFTFAAYGDSASGTATGFRQVQARVNALNPNFVVLLGDNVYTTGSHPESDARFDPLVNPEAAAWTAGHIDYLGLGNHDVGTASGQPSEQNFSVPVPVAGVTAPAAPPATERAEHSFSWDYGDVHFVTFDTNSYNDTARLDGLLKWVVADLNASAARWKIVYGHHPLAGVPDKPENPGDNYYHQVVNRLKTAGVDLFMTGHSHTYSWTCPLTGQVAGEATYADHGAHDYFHSSEGLPQLVSGLGGVEIRSGDYSQFPFVAAGFTSTTPTPARLGFSLIDVTADELTVKYVAADDGSVIDSFVVSKDPGLQTVSFQQGAGGYAGAVDTFVHENTPTTNNGAATSLKVDGDDPAGTGRDAQALLRFDNLFGGGAGQIPANATLRSAMLQLQVTNASVNDLDLHRMIAPWTGASTWNTLGNGVQANGVEAAAASDTYSGQTQAGLMSFNVLPSLLAWQSAPPSNQGWAILPTGTDGVDFNSSEGTTRPRLVVTYIINDLPAVADVPDQAVVEDTATTSIPLTVTDAETPAARLTVGVSSSNPALVPNGNLLVTGAGAARILTATPVANQFGATTITVTVTDNEGATASDSFVLTVRPVNDPPSFTKGGDKLVDEDPGPRAVPNWATAVSAGPPNEAGQGLTFLVSTDNDSAFSDLPAVSPSGMLTYMPAADWSGVVTVTLVLQDGGGTVDGGVDTSAPQTFTITVRPVNDAPAFTAGSNPVVDEDTGPQAVAGWATAISAGPPDEAGQALTFLVSNDNPTLFSTPPALTPAGELTFTPAANANGSATVTVRLQDSGGTTNGGADTSAPRTFLLSVTPVNDAPVAGPDTATVAVKKAVTIPVLANDTDVDLDTIKVVGVTQGTRGAVKVSGSKVVYTPRGRTGGPDSFTYAVADGKGGTATGIVSVSVTDPLPPTVQAVRVYYGPAAYADLMGLSRAVLPWERITRVDVVFSEDVTVVAGHLGVSDAAGAVPTAFTYNAAARTATWDLGRPLGQGRATIHLSRAGLLDRAGNPLARDWGRTFGLLAGDYTGNGVVDAMDLAAIKKRLGKADRFGDLDGTGVVEQADYDRARANKGKRAT